MGDSFEEIAAMLERAKRGRDIGVCFDTQHAFASGYDLRDEKAVNETVKHFDAVIGLKRLVMSHLNDSKCHLRITKIGTSTLATDLLERPA